MIERNMFAKLMIPNLIISIAGIVFLLATLDFFVVSVTMFSAPGTVMLWAAGVAVVCGAIMGITMYKFIFGDEKPRRNTWQ
jgi:hypothetical protein